MAMKNIIFSWVLSFIERRSNLPQTDLTIMLVYGSGGLSFVPQYVNTDPEVLMTILKLVTNYLATFIVASLLWIA